MKRTLVGGVVEVFAGLAIGVLGFMRFHERYMAAGLGGVGPIFASGTVMFLSFLVSLPGLLALYLFTEGWIRIISAVIVEEPCPTLAGWLIGRAWRWRPPEPERPDVVTLAGDALLVETSRRRDWDAQTTVAHDGDYYVLLAIESLGRARWRYRLGLLPERWLIRAVRQVGD